MNFKISLFFILLQHCCHLLAAQNSAGSYKDFFPDKKEKIIVNIQLEPGQNFDSIRLRYTPMDIIGVPEFKSVTLGLSGGHAEWISEVDEPYLLLTDFFYKKQNISWFIEPGDKIKIKSEKGQLFFAGHGSEKFKLLAEIWAIKDRLKKKLSNPSDNVVETFEDFIEWKDYDNRLLKLLLPLIDSYKDNISTYAYNNIKNSVLDGIIDNRTDKFYALTVYARKTGISSQDLCSIYDSTFAPYTTAEFSPSMTRRSIGSWGPVRLAVARKYNFDFDASPLNSEKERHLLYYELALKLYTGQAREKFLVDFLPDKMIKDLGFLPEVEAALAKYYAEPGYPEHKKYVKEFELRARKLKNGEPAPEFSLTGTGGNLFTKDNLKGKIALLDFWFTGCTGCVQLTPVLKRIEQEFRLDTNVVFLSISIDKDKSKWLKSIQQKKYTTGDGINLYTGGQSDAHEMIRTYNVTGYPSLYLLDGYGNVVLNPLPDPRNDNGAALIKLIKEQAVLIKDGPYVMQENGSLTAYSITASLVNKKRLDQEVLPALTAQTDEYGKTFDITLKKNLDIEPSEFARPEKLLALSDIEGNFDALRKLLQANGVINENYNWTFGKGHLVFTGDLFDRGHQVTECLWLLYTLEEKAKAAGGYVHFILGNHEIMNLSSDNRYAIEKYRENAERLGTTYAGLFNENSELGRWLHTKNIMEKIGDLLFVHGGISEEVNTLPLSITQINELARPYYSLSETARQSNDSILSIIFDASGSHKSSPFWYRNYYLDAPVKSFLTPRGKETVYKTSMDEINKTLKKFNVSRIITGHTVVRPRLLKMGSGYGEHISSHYDDKVFNIDTRHAKGQSEALLVEGGRYYRVNMEGDKALLFEMP